MTDQAPGWWPDYDAPDNVPRHACWLLTFADGTAQRIGAWPPLCRAEVINAYRCVYAEPDGAR